MSNLIQAVVCNSDDEHIIIHSHINAKGKMVLNKAEAALVIIELMKFLAPRTDMDISEINEKMKDSSILPKLNIAVVCLDLQDFLMWKKVMGYSEYRSPESLKRFTVDNVTYFCVCYDSHLHSWTPDSIVETPRACQNPEYTKLLELCKMYMRHKS